MIPESTAEIAVAAQMLMRITSPTRTTAAGLVPRCISVIATVMTKVRPTATETRLAVWRSTSLCVVI